jgi:hypothetical protein
MKRDRSARYRLEDRRAVLVRNDAAPDQRRLSADAVERILPLRDARGAADLGSDGEMYRSVLVHKPEQLLESTQGARDRGLMTLVTPERVQAANRNRCGKSRFSAH